MNQVNWLLVIALILILAGAVRGWRKGLLRVLFSLLSVIIVIVLVAFAAPHIGSFLRNNTTVYNKIEQRCVQVIEQNTGEKGSADSGTSDGQTSGKDNKNNETLSLPDAVNSILNMEKNSQADRQVNEIGNQVENKVSQAVGEKAAGIIVSLIAFLIAFIIAIIIVRIIGHMLGLVNKVPVLGGINRGLGIVAGGFEGLIAVWIILLLITLLAGMGMGQGLTAYVSDSRFLQYLYEHNGVLYVITHFLSGK